jgi:Uma2 family endonuclease
VSSPGGPHSVKFDSLATRMVSETVQSQRQVTLEHSVQLSGISWETYERLVDELERAGRRLMLTYDDGDLEIEMPSDIHEFIKAFVRALLECYLFETDTPYLPAGQTTYKRGMMSKGVEPDESYYLTNLRPCQPSGRQ